MPTVSENRPDVFSNWGDDSPTFDHDFVQPGDDQQASGWLPAQEPPCEYHNWLFWIEQRWVKNLDDRAPRVRPFQWYVGDFSGAHYATLAEALADSAVVAGDSIYVDFYNTVKALDTAITVGKQRIRIFFAPGSGYRKGDGAPANAFILTQQRIEIHGGRFDDWTDVSDCVFKLNSGGQYCTINGAVYGVSTNDEVDDTACPQYTVPLVVNTRTE